MADERRQIGVIVPDMFGDYPRHRRWWMAPLAGTAGFALMVWANARQIGVWKFDDANSASDHSGQAVALMAATILEFAVACGVWAVAAYPIAAPERAGTIRKAVYVALVLEFLIFWGITQATGMSLLPERVSLVN